MHRAHVNDKCPPKPRRAFVRLFVPTVKSGGRFLDKKLGRRPSAALAGEEGFEPSAYGFGDRRSAN